eukprot:749300-Hanusia_phi.AAC.11
MDLALRKDAVGVEKHPTRLTALGFTCKLTSGTNYPSASSTEFKVSRSSGTCSQHSKPPPRGIPMKRLRRSLARSRPSSPPPSPTLPPWPWLARSGPHPHLWDHIPVLDWAGPAGLGLRE